MIPVLPMRTSGKAVNDGSMIMDTGGLPPESGFLTTMLYPNLESEDLGSDSSCTTY